MQNSYKEFDAGIMFPLTGGAKDKEQSKESGMFSTEIKNNFHLESYESLEFSNQEGCGAQSGQSIFKLFWGLKDFRPLQGRDVKIKDHVEWQKSKTGLNGFPCYITCSHMLNSNQKKSFIKDPMCHLRKIVHPDTFSF